MVWRAGWWHDWCMSTADASERAEVARAAARARWTPSPVVARSVQVVVERVEELDDSQRAALEAAITAPGGESRDPD